MSRQQWTRWFVILFTTSAITCQWIRMEMFMGGGPRWSERQHKQWVIEDQRRRAEKDRLLQQEAVERAAEVRQYHDQRWERFLRANPELNRPPLVQE